MGSDLYSADLDNFLRKALGVQLADPEKLLSEEKLKEIARNAGLTEEDWENLCETLKGHLAKGRNFLKFANHTDAITELEQAVAIAPYRADVLVDCGKAHFGRWKETGNRLARDRAETLFRKSLEIAPDNADAAEQLSLLKQTKPASRIRRKMAAMAAVLLLAGGVSAWVGIPGLAGKHDGPGGNQQIESPEVKGRTAYPTAALPPVGSPGPFAFDQDLVAYWTFDGSSLAEDLVAGQHSLTQSGRVEAVDGVDGRAMRFFSGEESGMFTKPSTEFTFVDTVTVSAWVKPATFKSSQIVWFGDRRKGRDPWQLAILDSGQVRFRCDRSVTGDPPFTMLPEEIIVKPGDGPHLNQHVAADSPGLLPLNEWSFVTGRIQKTSSGQSIISVFVNGTLVSEVKTTEIVDYKTDEMWVTLGAVHDGNAQNFNGAIDEVRVYRSALSDEQIREIYEQPRRNEAGRGGDSSP